MPTNTVIADALAKLPRLSWRGIVVPIASVAGSFSHDTAQHKKPDRDGAKLEGLGLNPRTFTVKCLFRNGVVFEPQVYSDLLFPTVFRAFYKACLDRTTGDLIHPVHGLLRVKVASGSDLLTAGVRDGVDLDVTYTEDTEDDEATVQTTQPLSAAINAAAELDTDIAALLAQSAAFSAMYRNTPSYSFTDAMQSIRAASDTASLVAKTGAGRITQVQYQLDQTRQRIDALGSVGATLVRHDVERLQSALNDVRQTLQVTAAVALYLVRFPMTVGQISQTVKATISDLLTLNPQLAGVGVIPERTIVRHYK